MPVGFDEYFDGLPPERRARILARAAEMEVEEIGLKQLREAQRKSQVEVAERLKTTQATISRLERRTDVYLSTLRKYVEAVGGKLRITAEFPDGPAVVIERFGEK